MENALTVKVINGSTGESKAFEANGLCEESVLQRIALNERKLKVLGERNVFVVQLETKEAVWVTRTEEGFLAALNAAGVMA